MYSSFSKTHMPLSPYSVELPGTKDYEEEQENSAKDCKREDVRANHTTYKNDKEEQGEGTI